MKGTVPVGNKADALRVAVEGERGKVDLSKADWLDRVLVEELRAAIRDRARIKQKEDELESHKKDLLAQIQVLMETLGVESALDPKAGSVTSYTQQRSSLDKAKLKEELLKAGVPVETIVRCFTKATAYSESSGLKFTPI